MYYIKTGREYIRRDHTGKYVKTRNILLADKYDNEWLAKRVAENCLPAADRKHSRVVYEADTKTKMKTVEEVVGKAAQDENATEDIQKMKDYILGLDGKCNELKLELSELDQAIEDIKHYIEFYDLDADRCFYIVNNLLKPVLVKRRKVKNDLEVIRQIGELQINENLIYPILQIYHQIENKVYVPRKYPELFEEEKNVKEG